MLGHLSAIFNDFTMYQIEHVDKLSMLSMGDSVSVFLGGSGAGAWG